ncbi:MAG: hypothetical protein ACPGFA_11090 [Pikeienuella sp.]
MNLPVKAPTNIPMMDSGMFEQMQRVGKMLAMSPLFPEHLRSGSPEQALANAVLVVNIALRLNEDPLTVGQHIYFVSGRAGWSTSYLIAKANQHEVFRDPIDWEISGKGETLSVTAFATIEKTGKRVAYTCDMAMAKAENWVKNKKYQTMPELMLRYRSAAALIRLYCPEIMVGVPAQVDIELGSNDMRDITPQTESEPEVEEKDEKPKTKKSAKAKDAEVIEDGNKGDAEENAKPDEKADNPEPDIDAMAKHQNFYNVILADLQEAPNVKIVTDLYGAQIEAMEKEAPDLHKELIAEFKAFEDAQA